MTRKDGGSWAALACAVVLGGACGEDHGVAPAPSASSSGFIAPGEDGGTPTDAAAVVTNRSGSAIALTMAGDALLVASEDHRALFRVALPLTASSKVDRIEMPGAPAQVVVLADRVLVTVRDPGLLLELESSALSEKRRVALSADAWGLSVTPDAATAVVTSAWTRTVSGVDLGAMSVRWSKDVAREPRGVLVLPDGKRAYVSHLVGTAVTRIDGIDGTEPAIKKVDIAPAPARTAQGHKPSASLGYALVADPEGKRVFLPRHALGVAATWPTESPSWWGATTVDVFRTVDDGAIAATKNGSTAVARRTQEEGYKQLEQGYSVAPEYARDTAADGKHAPLPLVRWEPMVQPRAAAYRKRTHTLLVAGEGDDTVVELDARAIEPALHPLRVYQVGGARQKPYGEAKTGGAPTGIVLDEAEGTAFVFGRSTYDVSALALVGDPRAPGGPVKAAEVVTLAEDPLLEDVPTTDPKRKPREAAVIGRKLYYNASIEIMSGGMACAGCHPEGRDDGYTWHHEADRLNYGMVLSAGPVVQEGEFGFPEGEQAIPGEARQTPMLAGRVRAPGPYGWTGESETLAARVEAGFKLHHGTWSGGLSHGMALAAFLRLGLTPAPKITRALSAEEEKGRAVFLSNEAGCMACHDAATEYTDRKPSAVKVPARAGYTDDAGAKFKTPSLLWVSGTAPYFHNGSVATLEDLVLGNDDRMGKTNQLSAANKAALIAFLKTL